MLDFIQNLLPIRSLLKANAFCVIFLIQINILYPQELSPKEVEEIQAKTLAARRQITSYEMKMLIVSATTRPQGNLPTECERHLIYANSKLLVFSKWIPSTAGYHIDCYNCLESNKKIRFRPNPRLQLKPGMDTAYIESIPSKSDDPNHLNPLLIGFVSSVRMHANTPIDNTIGNKKLGQPKSSRKIVNNKEIIDLQFIYQNDPNNTATYSISPSEGYSITRLKYTHKVNQRRSILDIKLKQDPQSGIWFPESFDFNSFTKDIKMSSTQSTIQVISLNQPISPDRFEIASLGLPAMTRLHGYSPEHETYIWDGEKIRLLQFQDLAKPPETPTLTPQTEPTNKNPKKLLMSLGILSFLLFLIFGLGYWIRWKKQSKLTQS